MRGRVVISAFAFATEFHWHRRHNPWFLRLILKISMCPYFRFAVNCQLHAIICNLRNIAISELFLDKLPNETFWYDKVSRKSCPRSKVFLKLDPAFPSLIFCFCRRILNCHITSLVWILSYFWNSSLLDKFRNPTLSTEKPEKKPRKLNSIKKINQKYSYIIISAGYFFQKKFVRIGKEVAVMITQ